MGLVGVALVVCVALVASSDLKSQRVSLYQVGPHPCLCVPALVSVYRCHARSSTDFRNSCDQPVPSVRRMALYGIGSGAEADAENSVAAVIATFEGQDEMLKETLADEYYVDLFEEIAEKEEVASRAACRRCGPEY